MFTIRFARNNAVKSLGIGKVKLREIRLERMFDKPINTLGFFPV